MRHQTDASLACAHIDEIVIIRETCMRNMRSHPQGNYRQALARVKGWRQYNPVPSMRTLQCFLVEYARELDILRTHNKAGENKMNKLRELITGASNQFPVRYTAMFEPGKNG